MRVVREPLQDLADGLVAVGGAEVGDQRLAVAVDPDVPHLLEDVDRREVAVERAVAQPHLGQVVDRSRSRGTPTSPP